MVVKIHVQLPHRYFNSFIQLPVDLCRELSNFLKSKFIVRQFIEYIYVDNTVEVICMEHFDMTYSSWDGTCVVINISN